MSEFVRVLMPRGRLLYTDCTLPRSRLLRIASALPRFVVGRSCGGRFRAELAAPPRCREVHRRHGRRQMAVEVSLVKLAEPSWKESARCDGRDDAGWAHAGSEPAPLGHQMQYTPRPCTVSSEFGTRRCAPGAPGQTGIANGALSLRRDGVGRWTFASAMTAAPMPALATQSISATARSLQRKRTACLAGPACGVP